jgi:hypothetical protein
MSYKVMIQSFFYTLLTLNSLTVVDTSMNTQILVKVSTNLVPKTVDEYRIEKMLLKMEQLYRQSKL